MTPEQIAAIRSRLEGIRTTSSWLALSEVDYKQDVSDLLTALSAETQRADQAEQEREALKLSADAFERQYAERSKITVERLRELGRVVRPCACSEDGCRGWQSVSAMSAADYDRAEAAEASLSTLRQQIAGLVEEWKNRYEYAGPLDDYADELAALLDLPVSPQTKGGSV